jgi:hypothetical protein
LPSYVIGKQLLALATCQQISSHPSHLVLGSGALPLDTSTKSAATGWGAETD